MKISELIIEQNDKKIIIKPDGGVHLPEGKIDHDGLDQIMKEAEAFREYCKVRDTPKNQTKKPAYIEWKINITDNGKQYTTTTIPLSIKHKKMNHKIIKRKEHKYEFDVPLKPELVWCEWDNRKISCEKCGKNPQIISTNLSVYFDISTSKVSYSLFCSNCGHKINLDW